MKKLLVVVLALASQLAAPLDAQAGPLLFDDETEFQSILSDFRTDTFGEELGYPRGINNPNLRHLSDAEMSSIFGEVRYIGTGWSYDYQHGILGHPFDPADNKYSPVASVVLDFTETSVGTSRGVNAVGFEVSANVPVNDEGPNFAFVRYYGGENEAFLLPLHNPNPHHPLYQISQNYGYWGIVSNQPIMSIHIGKNDGTPMSVNGSFVILDDLTFGSIAAVPEPSTWAFMFIGFGFVGGAMRFSQRRRNLGAAFA